MVESGGPVRCAVGPDGAPPWLAGAVVDAGAELVPLDQAEVLIWWHSDQDSLRKALGRGGKLRWVQLPAAGIEAYADLVDDRLEWTCAKGVYSAPVAEHALALGLAGLRGLTAYIPATTWSDPHGVNLIGAPVTVIGGGGIASHLLSLLQPFGTVNTVVRRSPTEMDGAHRVLGFEDLHAGLTGARLVVLALALTPETVGVIALPELDRMAGDGWLVNVARGPHVVTDDLVDALRDGTIGGAALDVTDPEPLPPGHALWALPNCIITPHVGNTPAMHRPLLEGFTRRNLRRYAEGRPLEGRVDPALGY